MLAFQCHATGCHFFAADVLHLLRTAGDLPAAKLEELLDPRADQRTRQHIEMLRCLGLVNSVVIPDPAAEKPISLAPTIASRQAAHSAASLALHLLLLLLLSSPGLHECLQAVLTIPLPSC